MLAIANRYPTSFVTGDEIPSKPPLICGYLPLRENPGDSKCGIIFLNTSSKAKTITFL
jgi:hypothetical protein